MNLLIFVSIFILVSVQMMTLLEAMSGSVVLDSITFNKIIKKFRVVLVKFDIPYPFGEKHEEFEKVAKTVTNSDLLMAEVGVQQYGDKQNTDLLQKYAISADDLPVLKLFIDGYLENAIDFKDEFKADSIIRFIRKHSEIRITLNNGLEELDELAKLFVDHKITEEQRIELMNVAKQRLTDLTNEEQKKLGDIYIKIMDKVIKNGNQFIESETKRVNTLLNEKMTENKRNQLKTKLNILFSFSLDKQNSKNNEL